MLDSQEDHLVFDIPQDEIVVASPKTTATKKHVTRPSLGPVSIRQEDIPTTSAEDEAPIVQVAQRQAPLAQQPAPNFSGSAGSVRAITFLLISVACVLLVGSMIMTDMGNRGRKAAIMNDTNIGTTQPEARVVSIVPGSTKKQDRSPIGGRNFFARRPMNPGRSPRRSLRKLLRGSKCATKACVEQGTRLVDDLDPKIRPCDDFYQHVCSRWQHRQPAGGQSDGVSVDYILLDLFTDLLISVIRSDTTPFPELKYFLDECVQPQPNLFRNVRETILHHLQLKGWPYLKADDIHEIDLSTVVGSIIAEVGLETLLGIKRGPSGITVGQPRNLLLRHFLESEPRWTSGSLSKAYEAILETLPKKSSTAYKINSPTNVTAVEIQLRKILKWERGLYDAARLTNCTQQQMVDLPKAGFLDLRKFVDAATGGNFAVAETASVWLSSPKYVERMSTLPVSKHDLLNYVAFRVVLELTPLLSNWTVRSNLASLAYSRYAEFAEKLSPAQICVRFLERYDPVLPTHLVFHRTLELLGGAGNIREILDALKKAFLDELQGEQMFSTAFRQQTSDKLKDVYWEALMPYWLTERKAAESFSDGIYTNNPRHPVPHFFYFWLRTLALKRRQFLLGNKTTWTGGFLNARVTLSPPYRHLEIPLPVFDFMMSNDSSISHLHVPRVGSRVYRELHRFVYHSAMNYDLEKASSTEETRYHRTVQRCLQKQYKEIDYNPNRFPLNSAKTSMSDLLDLLSVRTALTAYLHHLNAHDGDYRLGTTPNLSGQQLFYIYYARSMCEKLNPRFTVKLMTHGPVSPAWYRVNGPLRNMKDFALTFGCSAGTPMNPVHKCI